MAQRSAGTRERVLDAAEGLFASRGYAATSIAEICERSGVQVGSVYHHFGSKEKLLIAVLERAEDAIEAALQGVAEEDSITAYYEHAAEATAQHVAVMRVNASLGLSELEPGVRAAVQHRRARTEMNIARELTRHCRLAGLTDTDRFVCEMTALTMAVYFGGIASDGLAPGMLRDTLATCARMIEDAIVVRAEAQRKRVRPAPSKRTRRTA